jgi:hypothetical protein
MILSLINYNVPTVYSQCNTKKKKMVNFFGNVLNAEKNILFLKTLMITSKKVGALLGDEIF